MFSAAAVCLVGGPALADSVDAIVDTVVDAGGTTVPLKTEKSVGFKPAGNTIVVKVAGYTCKMGSSTLGSVPSGCNYSLDLTSSPPKIMAKQAPGACMNITPSCSQ
ncbi:hypothetical protein LQ948_15805 [Jiella sp. MQZ9-1]|uniref:Uncharacterized protein n=1 Tax=Jiella flava TaxID=2816857 RepID=A0A939JX10_9HYPH|nr:hypothetical protein [Jiella flava]MBO0664099.1 hypothetical protein [Jiella flava]MCD2472670.1 hypothetical protein [Jiella flava]